MNYPSNEVRFVVKVFLNPNNKNLPIHELKQTTVTDMPVTPQSSVIKILQQGGTFIHENKTYAFSANDIKSIHF